MPTVLASSTLCDTPVPYRSNLINLNTYFFFILSLNIVYPMLFKLTNNGANRTTHCGVLVGIFVDYSVILKNFIQLGRFYF